MKILLTGASGFIGQTVYRRLAERGHQVRAALRRPPQLDDAADAEYCVVGEIGGDTDWRDAVAGVEAIVHLAGRAHVGDRNASRAVAEFRTVNVEGSVALFKTAQNAGVRRFVNVSSIGVLGQSTRGEQLSDASPPCPASAYAVSKLQAEHALAALAGPMELVTVRPPMVYGPGNPGNMLRLLKLVQSGVPLPLALASAKRDMVGVDNLSDILATCLEHPAVGGQTYVVCDGEPISTCELVQLIGRFMGRNPLLLPVPRFLIAAVAGLIGRREDVTRVFDPLRIDDRRFRQHTGWSPLSPLTQGLEQTVLWFNKP